MAEGLIADATIAANEAQADAFWKLRDTISEAERAEGQTLAHDISVAVDAMPAFIEDAKKRGRAGLPRHHRQRLRPPRRRQRPFPRPRGRAGRRGFLRDAGPRDHPPGRRPRHRGGRLHLRRARHRPVEARRIRPPRPAWPDRGASGDQVGARPGGDHEPREADPLALRREPDGVARALAVGAGGERDFVDREAGIAQAPGEMAVGRGRPHGEDPAGVERRLGRRQPARRIEPVVGVAGQPVGAVVDIEQDRVIAAAAAITRRRRRSPPRPADRRGNRRSAPPSRSFAQAMISGTSSATVTLPGRRARRAPRAA